MGIEQGVRINNQPLPVNLIEIASRNSAEARNAEKSSASFNELLNNQLGTSDIQFSKHAQARLHSRGIELTTEKINQLVQAIEKADSKGSKETLVLTDDSAFVVSVKNKTVITVFDKENLREGVVTSIDSAVIM
jgi:flagellar operon protein